MKHLALGSSLLLSLGLSMVGCGDSSACPSGEVECDGACIPEIEPTLTSIQSRIFDVSCAASACHDAELPQQMLDLSSLEASETNLINVASEQVPSLLRVAPGDSAASYLMNKLLGKDMAPDTTRMPQLVPDGLCSAKIDAVELWIDDGAPID